jgi:hypothetical protein
VLAALVYGSMTREQAWAPAIVDRLRLVAGVLLGSGIALGSFAVVNEIATLMLGKPVDQPL